MSALPESCDESPLDIRRAGSADIDAAAGLCDAYRQFYGKPADGGVARQFLAQRIEKGQSAVFLAWQGGRAVGFMQIYPTFSSLAAASAQVLNDLYVAADARRLGVARRLLDAAEAYAREERSVYLMLCTAESNEAAQELYESGGWKLDREFRYYYRWTEC